MRSVAAGRLLFAISIAGLGVLSLLSGDFALVWQPVPAWMPLREPLAYLSGAVLLIFGLGLLVDKIAALSTVVLTIDFLIWLLVLRTIELKQPLDPGQWLGFGETTVLVAGAWALLWSLPQTGIAPGRGLLQSSTGRLIIRLLFGLGVPLIGVGHFEYAKATADFVPAYLPAHYAFAYFTGACHIAAGLAVLIGVLPRLAATLEGIMMTAFGVMVWIPKVVAAPTHRFEWTAVLVSLAYGGGAMIVSGLFKEKRP